MVIAGVATGGATGGAQAQDRPIADPADLQQSYINYVAPQVEKAITRDQKVNKATVRAAKEYDQKHAGGNPVTATELAKVEAKAIKTGQNPRKFKKAPSTQQAKLLTILVEFDENVTYDWTGVTVPESVFGSRECVPAEAPAGIGSPARVVPPGPLHNKIPNPALWPAKVGAADNNSFWVEDFSPAHFNKMLYTDRGITQRVRPDLTGPDGLPGIDISGFTMKRMYEEMSKGAYTVSGAATEWVKVPNSEAYYAADTCTRNEEGELEAGQIQDMNGHPSNPRGPGQLAIDAVAELAAQQPSFPFEDYDIEDQGDLDDDNNFFEPDGVIDHVVLVHAGEDKSGGGGAEGTYAIWAHSSAVPGGAPVGDSGLRLSNYIVQPEDSGVGVFAHEYGHDLGLPDLYDSISGGDSDVDFWDLMASGSHSGPIFQSMPTHMGIWDKWVLGWANPVTVNQGEKSRVVQLGQTSRTPKGSADGIKINLPPKTITYAEPHSPGHMWWSGNDQNWADNSISRTVTAGPDVKFWMWNNYVIEEDWDFGFVEVSDDGGATWEPLPVRSEDGTLVSTPADYGDPHGNLETFGKSNGLTGSSDGWRHDYVDLSGYTGDVSVRLTYMTDAAFVERGWFADDFSLTTGTTPTWTDDVESGANGWTPRIATTVTGTPLGAGWRIDTGTQVNEQFYMAEWRNFDGFDKGLQYAYDTTYSNFGPWKVEKIKYNAPGMLVWLRDATYGDFNPVLNTTFDLPSTGTKGGLLLVDSHFDPLRRSGEAAEKDTSTLDNLPSRPQSSNVAFTLHGTHPFKECLAEVPGEDWRNEYCTSFAAQPPVKMFSDNRTWYPGIEIRNGEDLFFRDIDASVVLPNGGNEHYSVRTVDENGNPLPEFYGLDLGSGIVLGDGKPTRPYGVALTIEATKLGNSTAKIRVRPAQH